MNINRKIKFLREKLNELKVDIKQHQMKYVLENINLLKDNLDIVKGEDLRPSFKINRSTTLYTEIGDAQCKTCMLFIKDRNKCCAVKGKVTESDACNLYIMGLPLITDQDVKSSYNKDEAGFYEGPVRCENCFFFEKSSGGEPEHCDFYEKLNFLSPEVFDLDIKVSPKGCCTAFTPKKS